MKLALIGLGTVGTGVAKLLVEQSKHLRFHTGEDLDVKWVVVKQLDKARRVELPNSRFVNSIGPILEDPEVSVAIEVMGTIEPAFQITTALLRAGKHVVTANKALLAAKGQEIFAIARDHDRAVLFEAAVAGGIPIIAAVSQSLAPNRIASLAGILNGTSNYILTEMYENKVSYHAALAEAQTKGFAEADPTLDVDGTDAAQKLAILARIAFHSGVDYAKIRRQGIDTLSGDDIEYASELGYVIKLLASARVSGDELHLRVAPTLVHKSRVMAQVRGEYNAIEVVGDAVGETFYSGKGAGMMPTASSIVAGVLDLAIGRGQQTFRAQKLWLQEGPGPIFDNRSHMSSRFYLRYMINDQPGVLAQIAGVLGRHGVSIASVIQHEAREDAQGAPVPLVIMTHEGNEGALQRALKESDELAIVRHPTVCLHVAD